MGENGEKGTLEHCWRECELAHPLGKTEWWLLNKLNIELPYNPAIPLQDMYLKETKNTNYCRKYMHTHVHCSIT